MLGDELGKAQEGGLDMVDVAEIIEVVGINIKNHSEHGTQRQKCLNVLTGFSHEILAAPYLDIAA